jgi:predicted ThiF/HesA family dinucleotide-utilizing enzyme
MDCSLIDVTGDGAEDCIVVGTGKLLAAVDPVPGMLNLINLQVFLFYLL